MADNSKIDRILKDMEELNSVDASRVGGTATQPAPSGASAKVTDAPQSRSAAKERNMAPSGRRKPWWGQLTTAIAIAALWALLYILVAPFLVLWWTDTLALWVNGDYFAGILFGLAFGSATTLVTALLLIPVLGSRTGWVSSAIFGILASATALGWILSLNALFSTEANATRAREGLTVARVGEFHLWAGIASVAVLLVFAVAMFFALSYRRRGRQLRELRNAGAASPATSGLASTTRASAPAATAPTSANTSTAGIAKPQAEPTPQDKGSGSKNDTKKKNDGPDYSDWMSKIE